MTKSTLVIGIAPMTKKESCASPSDAHHLDVPSFKVPSTAEYLTRSVSGFKYMLPYHTLLEVLPAQPLMSSSLSSYATPIYGGGTNTSDSEVVKHYEF